MLQWFRACALVMLAIAAAACATVPSSAPLSDPLMAQADRLEEQGKYAESERLYRQRLIDPAGLTPSTVADTTRKLGETIGNQGRLVEAEAVLRRALALTTAATGERSLAAADAIESLAGNLDSQEKSRESVELYRQALAIRRDLQGSDHWQVLFGRTQVAGVEGKWRPGSEQEAEYRAALTALAAAPHAKPWAIAAAENNFAWQLNSQGRYAEAEPFYRLALDRWRTLYGDGHMLVASGYNNVASNLSDQGRYVEAEQLYRKAIEISVATVGKDHPQVARRYNNLSETLVKLGRKPESRAMLRAAYDGLLASLGKDHPETAIVTHNLGLALIEDGKLPEAEPLLRRAHDTLLRTRGPAHPVTAMALNAFSKVLAESGKPEQALLLRQAALDAQRAALGDSHPSVAEANLFLAQLLSALKRPVAAEQAGLAAVRSARRAQLLSAGSSDLDLAKITAADRGNLDHIYASYFAFAWERADVEQTATEALKEEAFLAAQDLLGLTAGREMALATVRAAVREPGLAAVVRNHQDLVAAAHAADSAMLAALGAGRAAEANARQADYRRLARDLARSDARLAAAFPAYRELARPAPMSIADVRKTLKGDEALLLMTAFQGALNIFVITRERAGWTIDDGEKAVALARRLRCTVDLETCPNAERETRRITMEALADDQELPFDTAAAQELYDMVLRGFEPDLKAIRRLNIVTTANLSSVPLAMLVTNKRARNGGPSLRTARWLADRFALTSLPSVAALRLAANPRSAAGLGLVGYGDPVLAGTQAPFQLRGGTVANAAMLRTLEPLPGTRTELAAMQALFGAGDTAIAMGAGAREPLLRADGRVATARVLVFATHALLPDPNLNVGEPGLVLTPPDHASVDDDGLLAASEVAGMRLDSDWVILSACNTASPDGQRGSSALSSLARAFLFAGSRALLASHWRVADDATAALTVETLRVWRTQPRLTRGQALQAAMRAVRTGRRADGSAIVGWTIDWSHPRAWAAFTHVANRDR